MVPARAGVRHRLNGLLSTSIGYFYVEDTMQRGTLLYSDSSHVRTVRRREL